MEAVYGFQIPVICTVISAGVAWAVGDMIATGCCSHAGGGPLSIFNHVQARVRYYLHDML